jgi:hypothetical protein
MGTRNWSPAATQILALVSGFPKEQRESRQLVMLQLLQTFIDDSKEPPAYVLAGFTHTPVAWAKFSDDWKSVLDQGPVPLAYFKMKEAAACFGQFHYWSESRRNERVNALIDVIVSHKPIGVYAIVEMSAYAKIFNRNVVHKSLKNPHFVAFSTIIQALIQLKKVNDWSAQLDFIFDEELVTSTVRTGYRLFRQYSPNYADGTVSAPIERNDKQIMPLQAADLLAWKIRRSFQDRQNKLEVFWPWKELDGVPMVGATSGERELIEFYESFDATGSRLGRRWS